MEKPTETFGVYFMKGAFYLDVKEVGDDLVAQPIHSKDSKILHVLNGAYNTLEDLLKSEQGEEAKEMIEDRVFDFLIIGYGEGVNYYINSEDGLKKCKATYIDE